MSDFTVLSLLLFLISHLLEASIHPEIVKWTEKKGKADQFFLSFVTASKPNVYPCPLQALFQAKTFSTAQLRIHFILRPR